MNNNPMAFIMQMLAGGNPQAQIQQIMQSNPQAAAIVNQMKESGMSPNEFLVQYSRQNNIDLTPIKNLFASRGIKL